MVREFVAFRAAALGISFALSWQATNSFAPSSAHIRPHSLLRSIVEPGDGGESVVGPAPPAFASAGRRTAVAALIAASTLPPPSLASIPPLVAPSPSESMKNAVVFGGSRPFPLASFGLQVYNDDTAYKLTLTALETGFRNFFASVLAGNQRGFARVGVPYICFFFPPGTLCNMPRTFVLPSEGRQRLKNTKIRTLYLWHGA